jgi:hypothetical protein
MEIVLLNAGRPLECTENSLKFSLNAIIPTFKSSHLLVVTNMVQSLRFIEIAALIMIFENEFLKTYIQPLSPVFVFK